MEKPVKNISLHSCSSTLDNIWGKRVQHYLLISHVNARIWSLSHICCACCASWSSSCWVSIPQYVLQFFIFIYVSDSSAFPRWYNQSARLESSTSPSRWLLLVKGESSKGHLSHTFLICICILFLVKDRRENLSNSYLFVFHSQLWKELMEQNQKILQDLW